MKRHKNNYKIVIKLNLWLALVVILLLKTKCLSLLTKTLYKNLHVGVKEVPAAEEQCPSCGSSLKL